MSDQDKHEKECIDTAEMVRNNIDLLCNKFDSVIKENERLKNIKCENCLKEYPCEINKKFPEIKFCSEFEEEIKNVDKKD